MVVSYQKKSKRWIEWWRQRNSTLQNKWEAVTIAGDSRRIGTVTHYRDTWRQVSFRPTTACVIVCLCCYVDCGNRITFPLHYRFLLAAKSGERARALGPGEDATMKAVKADVSDSGNSSGFVRATLAIPEHAVRVIASPPETLTQRNVEAVTGLSARTFLELIRSTEFPLRVRHIGKLRVVNREAFVQWLLVGEPKTDIARSLVIQTNDESDCSAVMDKADRSNELLASVGFRERAPARRPRRNR